MTHLPDTSGFLAHSFREPGAERVQALFDDPASVVGASVLTLFEVATAVANRTGDLAEGERASEGYANAVAEIVPVSREVVRVALGLRRAASARIALADCLIAATAAHRGAILVHRDPHFAALPAGRPGQEALPAKV